MRFTSVIAAVLLFVLSSGLRADVVMLQLTTFGAGLGKPARVTSTSDGWAATYPRDNKVVLFAADGSVVREIAGLNTPLGIAFSAPDTLYIGEESLHAISIWRTSGTRVSSFGTGTVSKPSDIEIDPSASRLYVLDPPANCVRVYDLQGNSKATIGDSSHLIKPTSISLDTANNTIRIGELVTGVCHVYNLNGTWQKDFGSFGKGPGQFIRVGGLAQSNLGLLSATDPFLSRIQLFDADGAYRAEAGTFGSELEQLKTPLDIAIGNGQRFAVADFANERLVEYWICHNSTPDLLRLPAGVSVNLIGPIVTAGTGDFNTTIYVENDDRIGGIRVDNVVGPIDRGAIVQISGTLATDGTQRYINASSVSAITGWIIPDPIGFPSRGLAGVSPNPAIPSVDGAVGPYNVGTLVKVWGKVAQVDGDDFYLSNGMAEQIWVHAPVFTKPDIGEWVSVTGISSAAIDTTTNKLRAQVLPRDAADIRNLQGGK